MGQKDEADYRRQRFQGFQVRGGSKVPCKPLRLLTCWGTSVDEATIMARSAEQ